MDGKELITRTPEGPWGRASGGSSRGGEVGQGDLSSTLPPRQPGHMQRVHKPWGLPGPCTEPKLPLLFYLFLGFQIGAESRFTNRPEPR